MPKEPALPRPHRAPHSALPYSPQSSHPLPTSYHHVHQYLPRPQGYQFYPAPGAFPSGQNDPPQPAQPPTSSQVATSVYEHALKMSAKFDRGSLGAPYQPPHNFKISSSAYDQRPSSPAATPQTSVSSHKPSSNDRSQNSAAGYRTSQLTGSSYDHRIPMYTSALPYDRFSKKKLAAHVSEKTPSSGSPFTARDKNPTYERLHVPSTSYERLSSKATSSPVSSEPEKHVTYDRHHKVYKYDRAPVSEYRRHEERFEPSSSPYDRIAPTVPTSAPSYERPVTTQSYDRLSLSSAAYERRAVFDRAYEAAAYERRLFNFPTSQTYYAVSSSSSGSPWSVTSAESHELCMVEDPNLAQHGCPCPSPQKCQNTNTPEPLVVADSLLSSSQSSNKSLYPESPEPGTLIATGDLLQDHSSRGKLPLAQSSSVLTLSQDKSTCSLASENCQSPCSHPRIRTKATASTSSQPPHSSSSTDFSPEYDILWQPWRNSTSAHPSVLSHSRPPNSCLVSKRNIASALKNSRQNLLGSDLYSVIAYERSELGQSNREPLSVGNNVFPPKKSRAAKMSERRRRNRDRFRRKQQVRRARQELRSKRPRSRTATEGSSRKKRLKWDAKSKPRQMSRRMEASAVQNSVYSLNIDRSFVRGSARAVEDLACSGSSNSSNEAADWPTTSSSVGPVPTAAAPPEAALSTLDSSTNLGLANHSAKPCMFLLNAWHYPYPSYDTTALQYARSSGGERPPEEYEAKESGNTYPAKPRMSLLTSPEYLSSMSRRAQAEENRSGQPSVIVPPSRSPADGSPRKTRLRDSDKPMQPLTIDTSMSSPAAPDPDKPSIYMPTVEPISPTSPPDGTGDDGGDAGGGAGKSSAKDNLLVEISRVDREINKIEHHIFNLKRKQVELEQKAKKSETDASEEITEAPLPQHFSLSHKVYSENRRKARENHAALSQLGPPVDLPLYNQPSDTDVYRENKIRHLMFKGRLMSHLRRRRRERCLAEKEMTADYARRSEAWNRLVEKMEGSPERKRRDAENRELFEKVFPKIRKEREDRERFLRVGSRVKSDADLEEIMDNLHEQEMEVKKMRDYAAVPPMLLSAEARRCVYVNTNGRMEDFGGEYKERRLINVWTDSEKAIFREKYLQYPKNFGVIASHLERKSVSDSVQHYYLSKKTENYKRLLKKSGQKTRAGRNRNKTTAPSAMDPPPVSTPPGPTIAPRFQRDYKPSADKDKADGPVAEVKEFKPGEEPPPLPPPPPPAPPPETTQSETAQPGPPSLKAPPYLPLLPDMHPDIVVIDDSDDSNSSSHFAHFPRK